MLTNLKPGLGQSQQNINKVSKFSTQVSNKLYVKTNGKFSAYKGRYYEKERTSTFYRKYSSRELTQKHRGKAKQLLTTMWWKLVQAPDMEQGIQLTIEQWRILSGENISPRHIKEMIGRFIARGEISVRDPKRTARHLNSVPFYSVKKDSGFYSLLEKVKLSIPDPSTISKKVFTQLLLYIYDNKSKVVASTQIDASTKQEAKRTKVASISKDAHSKREKSKKKEKGSMSYTLKNIFLKPEDERKILCFPQEALLWADTELPKYKSNQAPIDLFRNLCKRYCIQNNIRYEEAPAYKDPTTVNTKKGSYKSPNKNSNSMFTKSVHPPQPQFAKAPAKTHEEIEQARAELPHSIAKFMRMGLDPLSYVGYSMLSPEVGKIPFLLIEAGYKDLALQLADKLYCGGKLGQDEMSAIIAAPDKPVNMDAEPEVIAPIFEGRLNVQHEKSVRNEYVSFPTHPEEWQEDPNMYEDSDAIPLDVLEQFNKAGKLTL